MRILSALCALVLLPAGCRREHVKVQQTAVEVTTREEVHSVVEVDTLHETTHEPDRIVEEKEVFVFDPPSAEHPDAGPVLREIRKSKKVTETGAQKDSLVVAWHDTSDSTAKVALRVKEDAMEHTVSEPDLGYGWIYYALILAGAGYLVWRLRKYV